MTWDDLKYWQSGEWQVVQERLDDLDSKGLLYAPARHNLFKALDATPLAKVKAAIIGQDPYTNQGLATGLAFSVPRGISTLPPTLANILEEYQHDLHYPPPKHGDLSHWASEGVLLWNAIPSVGSQPQSHNWPEWSLLTREILQSLPESIVVLFLGALAREFTPCVKGKVLASSHPSPLGARRGINPFMGSRPFTTINSMIKEPIDWRIPDVYNK
jgi:uracil-DNA glycosylase